METSETRAKKFEAESIKLQKENTELTLELENSRKPYKTNQEGLENQWIDNDFQIIFRHYFQISLINATNLYINTYLNHSDCLWKPNIYWWIFAYSLFSIFQTFVIEYFYRINHTIIEKFGCCLCWCDQNYVFLNWADHYLAVIILLFTT